ncbi:MAG: MarR family transcriptional regulator [Planctomycetes bacterium]|nr:MarR family transcriptional regulator [Planctomycetota bacterium]
MELSAAQQTFILHWGEMGSKWGINRTVAQVHALLYLSETALHAEQISQVLQVARSNVSNCLKELQGWGIVKTIHVLGDRRDHFESLHDVWDMFRIILAERKRREIDPTMAMMEECIALAGDPKKDTTAKRLKEMQDFFSTMTEWYDQMENLPTPALKGFLKMGSKIKKFIGG